MLQRNPPTCQNEPTTYSEVKILVRFTKDYQQFKKGEQHELLSEDPVEELAVIKDGRIPYAVLERVDGDAFKAMDDLLSKAMSELAIRF